MTDRTLKQEIAHLSKLIENTYTVSVHVVQGITYVLAVPNDIVTASVSADKCFICHNIDNRYKLGPWEGLKEIPNFVSGASKEFSLDDIELAEKIMGEL